MTVVVFFFFQSSLCDFITTLPEIWQHEVTWSPIITATFTGRVPSITVPSAYPHLLQDRRSERKHA